MNFADLPFEELIMTWGLKIVAALLILIIGNWLAKRLAALFVAVMNRNEIDVTLTKFLRNIIYYALLTAVVIAAAGQLGINTTSFLTVVGTAVALGGLALGWFVPANRLLGPARVHARRGFRVGGGFDGLVGRPALAVARAAGTLDGRIHGGVVLGAGRLGMAVARASRLADERGIDGIIAALVRGTRDLGRRARRLQTGLVHRELLLAVCGAALLLALLAAGVLVP